MPFLVPVFANNMARYFDSESPAYEGVKGDISGVASPGTAKGWAESLKLASTAIFPPSVSIPAAEAACFGVLAGWSTSNDSNGNILVDGSKNILNVLNYSNSYKSKISKSELDEHLFYLKEKPNAIPYVTNYYGDNWGFCLSYNEYKKLTDDTYFVEIDTNFIDS